MTGLSDILIGAAAGWSLARLGRYAKWFRGRDFMLSVFNLPPMSPTGRFRFLKTVYSVFLGPEVPWTIRIVPWVGMITLASSVATHDGFTWYSAALAGFWLPILSMYMYLLAMRSFSTGFVAGSMDKASDAVAASLTSTIESRVGPVVVTMPDLLSLADRYEIPLQEIHRLVWGDD